MAQQQKSKIPLAIGLTAAAGVGYYLFQAGGNPTVAEKKFEGKSRPPHSLLRAQPTEASEPSRKAS
jgi:hypothetical protein